MSRWINILGFTALLLKRYWRSTLSLIVVYSIIVFAFASVLMFIQSLSYESGIVLRSLPDVWVQRVIGGRLVPIDNDVTAGLAKIRGVSCVHQRVWGYYFDEGTGGVFTIVGSDSIPDGLTMLAGKGLTSFDTAGVAVCGTGYLELHGVSIGSDIIFTDTERHLRTLRITGVFTSSSDLITRDLIVVPYGEARRLLGIGNTSSTDIAIDVTNPDEVETVVRKISQRIPNVRVVTREQLISTYQSLFGYRGSLFLFGLMISLLAFVILAWQKAGGLSSKEQREIGIQKAVGWSIPDIMIQKFCEGTIISFNATLLGLIAAYCHVFFFGAPLLKPFLVGWSVVFPGFHLLSHLELSSIVLVFFLSVIPYLAATVVPSWKAAISDPAEIMHA
ncbi:MAG TPA: ABC transporter permease [Bacteroidota bacterium]|nr:ABC transporter permease [Bacteroidota bacterium]